MNNIIFKENFDCEQMSDSDCCNEAGPGNCYYVGIGAMMNKVSLALRELNPIESWPCRCIGFNRRFWGRNGMAEIFEEEGAEFHGVLHRMTDDDLKKLDSIEHGYLRKNITCVLYDGTTIIATGYQFDRSKISVDEPRPPSERYVDIMALGMEQHGCHPAAIEELRATPNIVPRKKMHEFLKIPIKPGCEDHVYSRSDVLLQDGRDGRPLQKIVNRKVLQFHEPTPTPEGAASVAMPTAEEIAARFERDAAKGGGEDLTLWVARMLYEPRYPLCTSVHEMCEEHRAFVEDLMVGFTANPPVYYLCVGMLKEEDHRQDQDHKEKADENQVVTVVNENTTAMKAATAQVATAE